MQIPALIKKNIDVWLNGSYDSETKNTIKNLLKENPKELIDSFGSNLEFGTGGIRQKMGVGPNRLNEYTIALATQALANYIKNQNILNPSVVISFDNRKNSKFFSEICAKVLAANKIKVFLFSDLRPTPILSFAVREKKAAAGIMITASHNPPEYNGYKVYWKDGGQVIPPHDTDIINEYKKIKSIDEILILKNIDSPFIELIKDEIDNSYLNNLFSMDLFKDIEKKDLKIVYSNLHGTGITLIPKVLKKAGFENVFIVKEQEKTDPDFTNAKNPNPESRTALEIGIRYLKEKNLDLFIATDPDADRVAATILHNKKEIILTGNQMAAIMLEHLLKTKKISSKTACIKSIVTTNLLEEIAKSYKINIFNVLTGFKYISEKINEWDKRGEFDFIFGAEESLGFLIETFARDKDSISASLLLVNIAQKAKKNDKTLLDLLYDIYKKYGIYQEKQLSLSFDDSNGMEKMKSIMAKIRSNPINSIGNIQILETQDYQSLKSLNHKENTVTEINLPKTNMLKYILDDGSSIVIRPSGTEPKIKIYASTFEKNVIDIEKDILKVEKRIDSLLSIFKTNLFS